jgi:hypothetical protein
MALLRKLALAKVKYSQFEGTKEIDCIRHVLLDGAKVPRKDIM